MSNEAKILLLVILVTLFGIVWWTVITRAKEIIDRRRDGKTK